MPEQGVLRRLFARACPQFLEDWMGAAGARFRRGMQKVSTYNTEHVKIGDKIDAAPGMLWRAAEGATSAQHAKAEADYAKAETDRMDAELRRRTLNPKTRHEWADADKAEAEAGIAKIREIQARLELFKQLKEIGVAVTMDVDLNLKVSRAVAAPPLDGADLILESDGDAIAANSVLVRCPMNVPSSKLVESILYELRVSVGCRVKAGENIAGVQVMSSPAATIEVLAPATGVVTFVFSFQGRVISPDQPIATILLDK